MLIDNTMPATDDLYVYRKKQWSTAPKRARSKLTFRGMKYMTDEPCLAVCFEAKAEDFLCELCRLLVKDSQVARTRKASFRPLGKLIQNFITQTRIQY